MSNILQHKKSDLVPTWQIVNNYLHNKYLLYMTLHDCLSVNNKVNVQVVDSTYDSCSKIYLLFMSWK